MNLNPKNINIVGIVSFFLQRYAFLLKDARNFGKMFEGEGDNKKKQRKKGFFVVTIKIFMYFCKNKKPGVITSIE